MRLLSSVTAVAGLLAGADAAIKGWNIAATNPYLFNSTPCKNTTDWEHAFNKLNALPFHFKDVRFYASSDCNTLANALPAVIKTGTKVLAGVWTENAEHYENEKAALKQAIHDYGHDWITAISVGSEGLYAKQTTAATLVGQIRDVRKMVRSMGVNAPVLHVDTWTAWVDPANKEVIKACDVIGMDAYPYWQGVDPDQGKDVFFKALNDTRKAVHGVSPHKKVWVTETGHPWKGPGFKNSQPSRYFASTYWKEVACTLFQQQVNLYWYSYQDYQVEPSFGYFGPDDRPEYDIIC